MHISLRPATEADKEFLYDLHRSTMHRYIDETWGWDEDWQRNEFESRFRKASQQVILANGPAVGMLEIEYRPDELFIANIQVRPSAQRRGIGSLIINELVAQGRRTNQPVTLQVLEVNHDALRLYERLGFVITARTPPHIQMVLKAKG
jgi:ribosomal protein S18 acetylase RimI-like enzyme